MHSHPRHSRRSRPAPGEPSPATAVRPPPAHAVDSERVSHPATLRWPPTRAVPTEPARGPTSLVAPRHYAEIVPPRGQNRRPLRPTPATPRDTRHAADTPSPKRRSGDTPRLTGR